VRILDPVLIRKIADGSVEAEELADVEAIGAAHWILFSHRPTARRSPPVLRTMRKRLAIQGRW
jgi:hypothetical protein